MRKDVARCREDHDIEEAAAIMEKNDTRHPLALNCQQQETGIFSLMDLARRQIARKTADEALTELCRSA